MRALQIREQQLEAEHPSTATSLNNLALLYERQGKYEQAEPLYERALQIYEQQLGAEHPSTATSLKSRLRSGSGAPGWPGLDYASRLVHLRERRRILLYAGVVGEGFLKGKGRWQWGRTLEGAPPSWPVVRPLQGYADRAGKGVTAALSETVCKALICVQT